MPTVPFRPPAVRVTKGMMITMCSICGIFGNGDKSAIKEMNTSMCRRGPDQNGYFRAGSLCAGHNRLSVIDPEHGLQPMTVFHRENQYTIVYNGEIYNRKELNRELALAGISVATQSDTETVLWSYVLWGKHCAEKLNGIFAFAVYDQREDILFLCRDRLGVKPLYYTFAEDTFVFSSELKGILAYPGVKRELDQNGVFELLFLAPVTLPQSGTFKGIRKLLPGEYAFLKNGTLEKAVYWSLAPKPFTQTREEAIETVRFLVTDAVERQMVSDVPLCTLLSGGLDSSVISALAANHCKGKGETLSTYSFEYAYNRKNFKSSLFQPESDDVYASWLAEKLGTRHTVLTAESKDVFSLLKTAVDARDLPGQADIDSSLLLYCGMIKQHHTVALSGECSDEIFGGYPWFYRPEMLERPFFPWLHDPFARASLFDPAFASPDVGYRSLSAHYKDFVASVERGGEDDDEMYRSRIATQLSVWYFMQSLLERKDRMSMYNAVEVRVPFADHRILEYVYNVPWKYKFENGVEKSLLRSAMEGVLPDRILHRKKSPYPKTHDPAYELLTKTALLAIVNDPGSRLYHLLNRKKLLSFMNGEDATWFGQLMARPQLYAWLLQMEYWLETYRVSFV